MGILNKFFKRNNKSSKDCNDVDLLDFKNTDSILSIVVQLNKDIWNDTSKWEKNNLKMEQYLNRLLLNCPNETRALTNLGATLADRGKHEEALCELLKAEKLKSNDANLYRNLGIVKMNINEERHNAKKYFEKADKLTPNNLTFVAYFDPQGY